MRREMRAFNDTEPDLLNDERNRFVRVSFRIDSRESERAIAHTPRALHAGDIDEKGEQP